jgi:hypothetical protein
MVSSIAIPMQENFQPNTTYNGVWFYRCHKTAEGIYFADNHVANKSAVIEDVTDINVAE